MINFRIRKLIFCHDRFAIGLKLRFQGIQRGKLTLVAQSACEGEVEKGVIEIAFITDEMSFYLQPAIVAYRGIGADINHRRVSPSALNLGHSGIHAGSRQLLVGKERQKIGSGESYRMPYVATMSYPAVDSERMSEKGSGKRDVAVRQSFAHTAAA